MNNDVVRQKVEDDKRHRPAGRHYLWSGKGEIREVSTGDFGCLEMGRKGILVGTV